MAYLIVTHAPRSLTCQIEQGEFDLTQAVRRANKLALNGWNVQVYLEPADGLTAWVELDDSDDVILACMTELKVKIEPAYSIKGLKAIHF